MAGDPRGPLLQEPVGGRSTWPSAASALGATGNRLASASTTSARVTWTPARLALRGGQCRERCMQFGAGGRSTTAIDADLGELPLTHPAPRVRASSAGRRSARTRRSPSAGGWWPPPDWTPWSPTGPAASQWGEPQPHWAAFYVASTLLCVPHALSEWSAWPRRPGRPAAPARGRDRARVSPPPAAPPRPLQPHLRGPPL